MHGGVYALLTALCTHATFHFVPLALAAHNNLLHSILVGMEDQHTMDSRWALSLTPSVSQGADGRWNVYSGGFTWMQVGRTGQGPEPSGV
jgi:hypothetical protein